MKEVGLGRLWATAGGGDGDMGKADYAAEESLAGKPGNMKSFEMEKDDGMFIVCYNACVYNACVYNACLYNIEY